MVLAKVYLDCAKYKEAFSFINKASKLFLKSYHYDLHSELSFYKECVKLLNEPSVDFSKAVEEGRRARRENIFILNFPGAFSENFLFYLSNLLSYEFAGNNNFISHMVPGEKNSQTTVNQMKQIISMEASDLNIFKEFYEENIKNSIGYLNKVVDSTSLNFIYVPLIKKIFPDAKFIFINSDKNELLARSFINNIFIKNHLANYNLKTASELFNIFEESIELIKNKFPESFVEINIKEDFNEDENIKKSSLTRICKEIGTDLNLENLSLIS